MNIILYLLQTIQYLYQQNCWLIQFICRYIPLKQWAFDDSHSPKYQKFTIDTLPVIKPFIRQDWQFLLEYYKWKYGKSVKPVQRRCGRTIPGDTVCPLCGAPHLYLYDNNGGNGQYQCKVCGQTFITGEQAPSPIRLICPHCSHTLSPKKDRKHFIIHKCVNPKCPYYLHNLKKVDAADLKEDYGKNRYKLHYICRQFTIDFFQMDLNSLPKNASSLKFSKFDSHTMSLCLTLHVNLGLSLRKTRQALLDLYNISISHQQIANDDEVSKEFRPYKQMIERLNRTYKASYRPKNGFDGIDGANYALALWAAYYNFLRPHRHTRFKPLNEVTS